MTARELATIAACVAVGVWILWIWSGLVAEVDPKGPAKPNKKYRLDAEGHFVEVVGG